jgi:hypothetical protein
MREKINEKDAEKTDKNQKIIKENRRKIQKNTSIDQKKKIN